MSTRKKPQKAPRQLRKPSNPQCDNSLGIHEPGTPEPVAIPPARVHAASYHWPLLLGDGGSGACEALLKWFEGVEDGREMPWRKKWIDPVEFEGDAEGKSRLGKVLGRRAYEVWVSEIMLQQTRVSTVIPYFKSWISKWPTVQDLAEANNDEVLSVWKGLGYYSRATRLHQGAQDMQFPGIGKYTAGAISSIAFGEPEPVLDGNVARVLSRQLGLYVDAKDKKSTDFLWKVADRLVKHVAGFPETTKSAVPGQWNQALMELGSTICTPRPKCDECPIQKTCRAWAEGDVLLNKARIDPGLPDIEDACSLCDQLDTEDLLITPEGEEDDDSVKVNKRRKRETKATNKISHYFGTPGASSNVDTEDNDENVEVSPVNGNKKRKAPQSSAGSKYRAAYCSLFPKKIAKKKVAEEECVVCILEIRPSRQENSRWLIEQRPAKGLLASLWQFPQITVPASKSLASYRKTSAQKYISSLDAGQIDMSNAQHIAELDSLVHVFSHLKLTMHVHQFRIDVDTDENLDRALNGSPIRKWVATEAMVNETLSTGMRRCWELVKIER